MVMCVWARSRARPPPQKKAEKSGERAAKQTQKCRFGLEATGACVPPRPKTPIATHLRLSHCAPQSRLCRRVWRGARRPRPPCRDPHLRGRVRARALGGLLLLASHLPHALFAHLSPTQAHLVNHSTRRWRKQGKPTAADPSHPGPLFQGAVYFIRTTMPMPTHVNGRPVKTGAWTQEEDDVLALWQGELGNR